MKDAEVRSAVCNHLFSLHAADLDTLIVQEMGLWSGAARVDIAVINGELHGFELKSERDTLQRLPSQRRLYDLVFDRVTLVVAAKHYEKALPLIPDWWAVVNAQGASHEVELHPVRDGEVNPSVDALQIARLLWREECLESLRRNGGDRGYKSATSDKLAREMTTRLDLTSLREEVRSILKRRSNWLRQGFRDQRQMPVGVDLHPLRSAPGA